MIPTILRPMSVDDLLATLKDAVTLDIGNALSVTIGCGRGTKWAPEWRWIVDRKGGTPENDYSDMITLDGFGRFTICRRSNWDAKKKHYDTLDHEKGRFEKFTKTTTKRVEKIMRDRVANWYRITCGNTECFNPQPWK